MYSIVMGVSAAIAALAGLLVAPFQSVIPGMGLLPWRGTTAEGNAGH
jgi:branched-subunit amino acid ABC-type transport system permease component